MSLSEQIISKERGELDRILQNFNMHVENPCCILTQEMSKTFINGSEGEKYNFFLKATGLETISDDINITQELLEGAKEAEVNSQDKVKSKFESVQALRKDLQLLDSLEEHAESIRVCSAKLFWCDVAEARAVVEQLEDKNEENMRLAAQAETALEAAKKKKDGHGTVEEATQVRSGPYH
jgi:structural maintenance of chromosomes protein 6